MVSQASTSRTTKRKLLETRCRHLCSPPRSVRTYKKMSRGERNRQDQNILRKMISQRQHLVSHNESWSLLSYNLPSADDLLLRLDFRDRDPEVIDLSPEGGVVSTLTEGKIQCLSADKVRFLRVHCSTCSVLPFCFHHLHLLMFSFVPFHRTYTCTTFSYDIPAALWYS